MRISGCQRVAETRLGFPKITTYPAWETERHADFYAPLMLNNRLEFETVYDSATARANRFPGAPGKRHEG
jgi:hypothetical protein